MYVGNITTSTAVSANNAVPFTTIHNTNTNLSAGAGVITFNAPGFYKISGILNITNVAIGNISAQIMNGSTALSDSVISGTSGATTDYIALPLCRVVEIKASGNTKATCSIQLSANCNVVDANLVIEKIS